MSTPETVSLEDSSMFVGNPQSRWFPFRHDQVVFQFTKPVPNAWWRFWQWVFFGFRWEKVEE